eukprot:TRINITY_DN3207_c0_g1_i1.p1 TRINITY_DN3207_c0_g1~~TRINITY_DN3207_c0_g1_i1.p1  ORF type:complete len:389 (+),score=55.41 TRINITY_DN3207_c0_g1_i1:1-1167(+)
MKMAVPRSSVVLGVIAAAMMVGLLMAFGSVSVGAAGSAQCHIPYFSQNVQYTGRVFFGLGGVAFDWTHVQITTQVKGATHVHLHLKDEGNAYNVYINGVTSGVLRTNSSITYLIAQRLSPTQSYNISIIKRTEPMVGVATFLGFTTDASESTCEYYSQQHPLLTRDAQDTQHALQPKRRLEFVGASISCGFGVLGKPPCDAIHFEDSTKAYGSILGRELDAEIHMECWAGKGVVKNYGAKNDTSKDPFPVYYPRTIAQDPLTVWNATSWVPDAVVFNLGTNDYGSQPYPPSSVFENGFIQFIHDIRGNYSRVNPNVHMFLMCGPMVSGVACDYVKEVAVRLGPSVAHYIDLQNLVPVQDQGCDGHPGVEGHIKIAAKALPIIKQVLHW